MSNVVRAIPARDDLRQIWLHIAEHNIAAAYRVIDRIDRTLWSIARNPVIGELVEQYRVGLRRFTVGNYVLYYESIEDGIRLVRVLHRARRSDQLLE
jgi:toxin ParE1/3/4